MCRPKTWGTARIFFQQLCQRIISLSLSNGNTARGGPRPPSRVSSILPGLGRLLSNSYIPALLHLSPLHLPSAVWVSIWGAFLLAHWGGLSWINRHPGVSHVLPISVYSACRISQCHAHHTADRATNNIVLQNTIRYGTCNPTLSYVMYMVPWWKHCVPFMAP
jgi:hypothetical protein